MGLIRLLVTNERVLCMLVAINAGHCVGKDCGAVGAYSTEAEIVRDVAKIVCSDLNAVGINTVFIQENDLSDICNIANTADADLFISIHCNSAGNPSAVGTETYFYNGSKASAQLAKCVQSQLVNSMKSVDRGLKDGSWLYVLKHTAMPAVLTELDFINNPHREKYMNDHKALMAHAIARAVTDYQLL